MNFCSEKKDKEKFVLSFNKDQIFIAIFKESRKNSYRYIDILDKKDLLHFNQKTINKRLILDPVH